MYVQESTIIPSFKSDHSLVLINMKTVNQQRGHGFFKSNNSMLFGDDYQVNIKKPLKLTKMLTETVYGN